LTKSVSKKPDLRINLCVNYRRIYNCV